MLRGKHRGPVYISFFFVNPDPYFTALQIGAAPSAQGSETRGQLAVCGSRFYFLRPKDAWHQLRDSQNVKDKNTWRRWGNLRSNCS
jgi:hypothetical protein